MCGVWTDTCRIGRGIANEDMAFTFMSTTADLAIMIRILLSTTMRKPTGNSPLLTMLSSLPCPSYDYLHLYVNFRLDLQYVDEITALKYILSLPEKETQSSTDTLSGQTSSASLKPEGERASKSRERGSSREREKEKDKEKEKEREKLSSGEGKDQKGGGGSSAGKAVPVHPSHSPPTEALLAVKSRLVRALDAARSVQEGSHKKASKGKSEERGDDGKGTNMAITEAMCRLLPPQVIRQCIGALLRSEAVCLKRGAVLDVWEWAVQGLADLRQIIVERDEGEFTLPDPMESFVMPPPSRGRRPSLNHKPGSRRPSLTSSTASLADKPAAVAIANALRASTPSGPILPEIVIEMQVLIST